jgi:esterase/lipase
MRLVLDSKVVNGIPLTEYYLENMTAYKSLVFVQHGYQSTKEIGADYLGIQFARDGHFVVAIDAYKHGERIAEPYLTGSAEECLDEAFIVVKHTASDIIRLHHHHYKKFPTFNIVGISLGGMVAYYAATKTKKIQHLIPVISTPDFNGQAYHAVAGAGIDTDKYFSQDKLDFIKAMDPIQKIHQMSYEYLHILCGTKDLVVPRQASREFYDTNISSSITYKEYDVEHTVSREMQNDIIEYLNK